MSRLRKTKRNVNSKPEESWVYFVQAEGTPHFKIGVTGDIKARVKAIQTGCPYNVIVREIYQGGENLESQFHEIFRAFRGCGEWFTLPLNWRDYLPDTPSTVFQFEQSGFDDDCISVFTDLSSVPCEMKPSDDMEKVLKIFELEVERRKMERDLLRIMLKQQRYSDVDAYLTNRSKWLRENMPECSHLTESHQVN